MINSMLVHPNQLHRESHVTDMMDHASPCTTDLACHVHMELLDIQKKKGVKPAEAACKQFKKGEIKLSGYHFKDLPPNAKVCEWSTLCNRFVGKPLIDSSDQHLCLFRNDSELPFLPHTLAHAEIEACLHILGDENGTGLATLGELAIKMGEVWDCPEVHPLRFNINIDDADSLQVCPDWDKSPNSLPWNPDSDKSKEAKPKEASSTLVPVHKLPPKFSNLPSTSVGHTKKTSLSPPIMSGHFHQLAYEHGAAKTAASLLLDQQQHEREQLKAQAQKDADQLNQERQPHAQLLAAARSEKDLILLHAKKKEDLCAQAQDEKAHKDRNDHLAQLSEEMNRKLENLDKGQDDIKQGIADVKTLATPGAGLKAASQFDHGAGAGAGPPLDHPPAPRSPAPGESPMSKLKLDQLPLDAPAPWSN